MANLYDVFEEQDYYEMSKCVEPQLSEAALKVMEKKYLRGETAKELFQRVATAVVTPLKDKIPDDEVKKIRFTFYNMMASRDFLPNSPTLMNAGRTFNQMAACFVVPVEDSMEGIFRDAIADMAMIQRTGGGTGFDFSKLRPSGATVSSTMGESSGPISFMRAFNACTETVKQGGARRGANMGILRVDHPDIKDFIALKSDLNEMTNFNLSVAITDEFMTALEAGTDYNLQHNGTVYGTQSAQEIWDMLGERAWTTGEPGIIFIDTVNAFNTLPDLGDIAATNPCGEQPLLPYEACNLGSINLSHCMNGKNFDFDKLATLAKLATCFLDCVIDAGTYPLPQITEMVKNNRKIGLGVMGFADILFTMELGYDDPAAARLAADIMAVISNNARDQSRELAEVFGAFPNIDKSIYESPIRNAAITTIAPTGTISMIADTSYGIEPYFSLSYVKTLTDGGSISVLNPHVSAYMDEYGFPEALKQAVLDHVVAGGTIKGVYNKLVSISGACQSKLQDMEDIFVTAGDVAPYDHIAVQAAFQKNTDNAVSKTINFNNNVSIADIQHAFMQAYKSGCKGVTVYRDGCRDSQPMKATTATDTKEPAWGDSVMPKPVAGKRPKLLKGYTKQISTGCGMMLVTANMDDDDNLYEVLMRAGASGGCSAYTDAVARLISIALRYGVPVDVLIDQLCSVRCDNFRYQAGKNPELVGKSCPDVVGKFLKQVIDGSFLKPADLDQLTFEQLQQIMQEAARRSGIDKEISLLPENPCPECGHPLTRAEGCLTCINCGYSKC